MEEYFIVDYDTRKLYLKYKGDMFKWDLNEGDVGDFWHSFEDKHDVLRDINFHVDQDRECVASLQVYELDKGGYIDMSKYEDIPMLKADGDINNYLNQ